MVPYYLARLLCGKESCAFLRPFDSYLSSQVHELHSRSRTLALSLAAPLRGPGELQTQLATEKAMLAISLKHRHTRCRASSEQFTTSLLRQERRS